MQVDAKKQTIKKGQALDVLANVDQLYVAKGKRVLHVDLRKARPPKAISGPRPCGRGGL